MKVDKKKSGLEEKLKEKPEMDSGTPQQGDERGRAGTGPGTGRYTRQGKRRDTRRGCYNTNATLDIKATSSMAGEDLKDPDLRGW